MPVSDILSLADHALTPAVTPSQRKYYYPPPGSKRHHEIGNATPKPRLYPQHRKSQVLWRVSIRYRPLIGPVQAWCYQSRDGALNRGGDSIVSPETWANEREVLLYRKAVLP